MADENTEDLLSVIERQYRLALDGLRAELDAVTAERDRLREWQDAPLPEDAEIDAAFPTRSGRHDLYAEAMRLVGARHSKGALVALVNWLLFDRDRYRGLIHTEGIAAMYHCDRHEMGYMAPDHVPAPKCPRCELERVEAERDRYKTTLEDICGDCEVEERFTIEVKCKEALGFYGRKKRCQ